MNIKNNLKGCLKSSDLFYFLLLQSARSKPYNLKRSDR